MSDDAAKFIFRIEKFMPLDLPMRRLSAYIDEFARLLGEESSTRLVDVAEGSTKITALALPMAVPKVRARLSAVRDGALDDARRAINRLDTMLSDDNTSATLVEDGNSGVIICFPGANAVTTQLPLITEYSSRQGELVRIGGRGETSHATLRDDAEYLMCVVSHDLARSLAKYLYGPTILLHGRGRWRRRQDGVWEAADFRTDAVEVLDDTSLAEAAKKLQAGGGFGNLDATEVWDSLL